MATQASFEVETDSDGARLDVFLVERIPEYSRTKLRDAISSGQVLVNGRTAKPSYKVVPGEKIECHLLAPPVEGPIPEEIPLDILYDDEELAVVNKPPGMVVHPSKGHWQGTLTSALAYHFQNLSQHGGPQRPGIVHRLDRDTSGVIVIAKTDSAHIHLAAQFEKRTVEKEYMAIVSPPPDRERDWIDLPIGPHPYQREKMAIRKNHREAREARTFFEVTRRMGRFALVKVLPKTGRTHQIRVHFQSIGSPIVADKLYSGHSQISFRDLQNHNTVERTPANQQQNAEDVLLNRQALHARRLKFTHPVSGDWLELEASVPNDIQRLLDAISS